MSRFGDAATDAKLAHIRDNCDVIHVVPRAQENEQTYASLVAATLGNFSTSSANFTAPGAGDAADSRKTVCGPLTGGAATADYNGTDLITLAGVDTVNGQVLFTTNVTAAAFSNGDELNISAAFDIEQTADVTVG
ncbi:MAG: hypothetical protein AAF184_09785 [Pseudomonadota bacterium]